jgi:hypothetical protein
LGRYQGCQGGIGGLGVGRGAAEALGDCAAKDLQIMDRRANANPIPVYLNHRVSTPQGGWSAAVFYPLGHPMPYKSGDRQYRRRRFGNERNELGRTMQDVIGIWQGVAMDTLELHLGPPHSTPLRPVG